MQLYFKISRDKIKSAFLVDWLNNIAILILSTQEYNMTEYSAMQSIDDYKNVCLQFGNLTLFVAAVPFLPLLACIKNFLEIRVDGWKLINGFR